MDLTAADFKHEIQEALKVYDKYVVCLDKSTGDCEEALSRLMEKAIDAYRKRPENLRHGIALDKQVTIILSQTDEEKPLCGIYFNLHTPYRKNGDQARKTAVK